MSILENFLAGREARRQADAADRVNAMQSFVQQNGQALFAGDQNALGQLAQFDPQAAFAIQGQIDERARSAKADARAEKEAGRDDIRWQHEMEKYAASVDAETAAKEAQHVEKAVKAALAAQTPEQFDALMEQFGQPDLKGQFENREALAAQFMTMAEVLKMRAKPEAQTEAAKLKADRDAGLITEEQYQAELARRAPRGTSLSFDPNTGQMTFSEGVGVGGSKAEVAAGNRQTATDVILGAADKARELIGKGTTGLIGAAASYNPESDAAEVYRQVEVLRSNATVENLTAMRAASPTGGALGNITQQENKMLADKAGALDPKAGPERFRAQLDDYEQTLLRIIHGPEAGDAIFKATREKRGNVSSAGAPQVGDVEDGWRYKGGPPDSPDSWEPAQ